MPSLKPSSISGVVVGLVLLEDSPPSSPKRNAAFSRLGPEVGFLPDFKNGEPDFGGEDGLLDIGDASGSSIQENDEFAIVDRVGTGGFGRMESVTSDSEPDIGSGVVISAGGVAIIGISMG